MRVDRHWAYQGETRRGVAGYGVNFRMRRMTDARPARYFDAVDGTCDVFIDGKKVGHQKGNPGYTWQHSFFVPLESGLAPGKHALALRVQKATNIARRLRPSGSGNDYRLLFRG